jgi:hypothetical protein
MEGRKVSYWGQNYLVLYGRLINFQPRLLHPKEYQDKHWFQLMSELDVKARKAALLPPDTGFA